MDTGKRAALSAHFRAIVAAFGISTLTAFRVACSIMSSSAFSSLRSFYIAVRGLLLPVMQPQWVAEQIVDGMVSGQEMLLLDRYGLHIFDFVSVLMGADTEADTFQGRGKEWVLSTGPLHKGCCTRVA
jgi:hypothetical protein